MAGFQNVQSVHMPVAAAIGQLLFVEMGANGVVAAANAAADDVVGISLESRSAAQVTAGDVQIPVALPGCKCKVTAGAAISIASAAPVTSNASGQAVLAVATNKVLGYALQAAGAAGDQIEILFLKGAGVL